MKKLSIITVNYNDAAGLEKTLSSITKTDIIQVFVIDGGSTDGSLSVINKYSDIITSYISEKDNGIYDAMNKGLTFCDGEFVLFLNSGDYFNKDISLNVLFSKIDKNTDKNKVIFWSAKINSNNDFWYYPPLDINDTDDWMKTNLPNHQAMLFPKCFYKNNKYDLAMKIISDADYKYRAIKEYGYMYISQSFSTFELGGISSQKITWKYFKIRLKDFIIYTDKHYSRYEYIAEVLKQFGKLSVKLLLSKLLPDEKYSKIFKK
ncbi:glycosyltransferase [Photobacterium carnosum]|nr:glycosyltransferase [Photobacterium carnosum]